MILARGMRNNNPLNIIKSEKINWQVEVKWDLTPDPYSLSPDPSPKREGRKGEEMRNERPPLGLPEGRSVMWEMRNEKWNGQRSILNSQLSIIN